MAKKSAGKSPESQSIPPGVANGNGGNSGGAPANRTSASRADEESALSMDEIAARAYEIYEREGGGHGRDMDHWLRAESELKAERQKNRTPTNPAPDLPRSARQHQESGGI